MTTFNEVAQKYLKLLQTNDRTKSTYRKILYHHWIPIFNNYPIKIIGYEVIMEVILSKEISNKYLNQILIPLRGVFTTAVRLRYIDDNPMDLIQNRKVQKDLPEPFTKDEMQAILDWLKKYNRYHYLYYELAFWTGLRPCELLALTWSDIDTNYIHIHKSRLDGVEKSTTKTNKARYVILNDRSRLALKRLYNITGKQTYVFTVPNTSRPYYANVPFRDSFKKALKHTGIKDRPAYNTRHTYATMLLMSGVNATLVANQLGHSLQILLSNYARWLQSDKDLLEIHKLHRQ